jgi:hypothetical protein
MKLDLFQSVVYVAARGLWLVAFGGVLVELGGAGERTIELHRRQDGECFA